MATEPDSSDSPSDLLARYRVMSGLRPVFDAFRESARQPHAPKREIVVIVHGTFANDTYDTPCPSPVHWWEPYGAFGKALDRALERHGSAARCSLPVVERLKTAWDQWRPRWNGWSGANSEVERRQGAFDLAQYLRALQADDTIRTIHIVAHSHGGNVVRRAFRYMNRPTHKLGRVICLGTPFLPFADGAAWRRWVSRVHWPMLLVLAVVAVGVTLGADWFMQPNNEVALYVVAGIVLAAVISLMRYWRSSEANSQDVPAIALQFAHDEAIQLLRSCAALTAEPHVFLRNLLGGTVEPRERAVRERRPTRYDRWYERISDAIASVGRFAGNGAAWFSDAWNRPVCDGAERITSLAYRLPIVGSIAGSACLLLLIMAFRPYRPAVRPYLTSRLPRLRALFFHTMDENLRRQTEESEQNLPQPASVRRFRPHASFETPGTAAGSWVDTLGAASRNTIFHPDSLDSAAALAPVLVYWLLFYPLDKVAGLLPWLGAVFTRFLIVIGVRAAAASAHGVDMLGAAFEPERTGEPPAGVTDVTVPALIERDLEQRIDARMRANLAPLRAALDPARHATLVAAVRTAFTDPALLHSQYYQDERVVDFIAGLIAGTVQPELWETLAALGAADRESGNPT